MHNLKIYKNKILILMSIIVSCLVLCFTLTTKAYTINNEGNLVGDNLFYIDQQYYNDYGGVVKEYNPETQVLSLNGINTISESNGVLKDLDLQQGSYYLQSFYINGTSNGAYRLVAHTLDWSWQTTLYVGYNNSLTTFTITENSNIVRLEFYGDLNTFYNLNNYISISKTELEKWEPYGVWYSETNYNTQEQYYKELLNNNSNVIYNALDGATIKVTPNDNYRNVLAQDTISMPTNAKTFNEGSYPNVADYLANYDSEDTTHYPSTKLAIIIDFNFQINNQLTFEYNTTTLDIIFTFKNTIAENEIQEQRDNTYPYLSIQNKDKFTFNQLIYDGIYLPDYTYINFNISLEGVAYANGYSDGVESQRLTIKDQANRISKLESQIKQGNTQQYQLGYNDGFNQGASSGNQLYNMIIAVADTPINIFKQIFNFNILGLDISGFIFGIISLIIIIWLIKKII